MSSTTLYTFTTPHPSESAAPLTCGSVGRGGVVSMPHYKHTVPSPHPDNAARTMTVIINTDCPRCGKALEGVGAEPDDLLHCPHCRGALEACIRIEDGDQDRSKDIVTIGWFAPAGDFGDEEPCDCAGCESLRTGEVG